MQGRLQGKRLHGRYFLDHVVGHGTEGCNYLLGVDVDMNTVDGYAITSWDQGYGDMEFVLDLRHDPPAAAPAGDGDGPVRPRVARPPAGGCSRRARSSRPSWTGSPSAASSRWPAPSWSSSSSRTPTRRRWRKRYRDLTPANQYNVDYSILGTTRVEPLLRDIRNTCTPPG